MPLESGECKRKICRVAIMSGEWWRLRRDGATALDGSPWCAAVYMTTVGEWLPLSADSCHRLDSEVTKT